MTALENAILQIVTVLRTVTGFSQPNQVPVNPPSVMSYSTFAITYPFSGVIEATPTGTKRDLHNIAIDLLTNDTDLARSTARLNPYVDNISLALIQQVSYDSDGNPGGQFANSIETFGRLTYSWIPLTDYGGVPVIGYHFLMEEVKILVNL